MKTRSRPRYSITTRDASMAGGVTGEMLRHSSFLFPPLGGVGFRGSRRSRRRCARQGRRAATFALSGRTRRSAFCALDSTRERRLLGREEHAHMVAQCAAPQANSCHRPANRSALEPADRHRIKTSESMWGGCRCCCWFSSQFADLSSPPTESNSFIYFGRQ